MDIVLEDTSNNIGSNTRCPRVCIIYHCLLQLGSVKMLSWLYLELHAVNMCSQWTHNRKWYKQPCFNWQIIRNSLIGQVTHARGEYPTWEKKQQGVNIAQLNACASIRSIGGSYVIHWLVK